MSMFSHPMPTASVKDSLGKSLGFFAPVAISTAILSASSAASEGEFSPVEI